MPGKGMVGGLHLSVLYRIFIGSCHGRLRVTDVAKLTADFTWRSSASSTRLVFQNVICSLKLEACMLYNKALKLRQSRTPSFVFLAFRLSTYSTE